MNRQRSDFERLQRFSGNGDQTAFTELVRRHLDLVFATALRKVEDPHAAQEIAQNVFVALARKAWRFAPDDSLPAWLHKTALLESKCWLRGELRRRRRERTAAELGTTMNTPQDRTACQALLPLLDDALLSLRDKDRTALLLRYYENQSLREVGSAFGVNEDTAQKRVQTALHKLAEFFRRRGFRTATVATTVAALEYTAAPASAAMVNAVALAALRSAAPAAVGLGGLIARLAALSRAQTATICVVLVGVPTACQVQAVHAAHEENTRVQARLLAAQTQRTTLQLETERWRANSGRLEQSLAQLNQTSVLAAESSRAFETWKTKMRQLLTGPDYRWPDDSPFVRIPKELLPQLFQTSDAVPFGPPGVVKPYAGELLGLNPSERQSLERTLSRYMANLEDSLATMIYQTNNPSTSRPPNTLAATEFISPGIGGKLKDATERLQVEIRDILGEDRWSLVQARLEHTENLLNLAGRQRQSVRIWVGTDDNVVATWSGPVAGYQNAVLSMFLPEGDPRKIDGGEKLGGAPWPVALRERALGWLREQATARFGQGGAR